MIMIKIGRGLPGNRSDRIYAVCHPSYLLSKAGINGGILLLRTGSLHTYLEVQTAGTDLK